MKSVTLTRILARAVPAALALPLCLAAGCLASDGTDDDTDTDTDTASAASTESLGGVCHFQLPFVWTVGSSRCAVLQHGTIDMAAGETFELVTPFPPPRGFGVGRVHLTCNADGSVTESRKTCKGPIIVDAS